MDLIPVLSFLYLRGICRYCHKKLSIGYPLSEVFTGVLFSITYVLVNIRLFSTIVDPKNLLLSDLFTVLTIIPFTPDMIFIYFFAFFITAIFIVIFLADIRYGIIPDKITLAGIIGTIIYLLVVSPNDIPNHILAALGASLFFFLIYALTKGKGLGFGDVKLGILMGLLLGFPDIFLAFYMAFLTGGVSAIILILWRKKKMKSTIAFGPFLVLGAYLSFFLSILLVPEIVALLS